ncbi:protein kinase [Alloactinosynnema sp. L-07]|uniref:serine/threonine protein kinase n=1 Tax=Alloactinosynnema sp. L-07 TaxID=1653480 RepID=UPI00065F0977|nr:serine/threonine-protein kinase [Alloactinosynnema sp. L-07]CRK58771.1 protein kinase [Alloactinosynnema sp. L-07]
MQTTGGVHDLRPLADGPVATVYVGRLGSSGAEVAVKVFTDTVDRDTAAWLGRERKALHQVRQVRSILPVEGLVDHTDGRTGVWMELCQGSLASLLTGNTVLTPPDALLVGTAIAEALTAAHSVGVVHGGVTPHNVLFRRTGEVAVSDFGLALRERFPRDPMHAVEYMAPETLRDGTVSAASDLYGLGAVLYTALTGSTPFPRRSAEAHGDRILRVLREPVPPISSPLGDVIGLLLAKDPDARPRAAEDVLAAFKALSGGVPAPPVEVEADGDYDFDDFADFPPTSGFSPAPPSAGAPLPLPPALPAAPARPAWPVAGTQSSPVAGAQGVPGAGSRSPGRTLVRMDGPGKPARGPRAGVLIALGGVIVVLAGALVFALMRPAQQASTPPSPMTEQPRQETKSVEAAPEVRLELAKPADEGTHVQLSWSAEGDLDFAVVVAGEQLETSVVVADRRLALRIPVDPGRKYCFQVRATDGKHIYTSDPQAIRGARCKP